jgi:hypothetical protein
MSIFTLLLMLNQPVTSDRDAAPVEIEAPAEATDAATPEPQPQPAPVEAKDWGTPVTATPVTTTPPPPPPPPVPPPAPAKPVRWRVDIVGTFGTALFRDSAWRAFDRDRNVLQFGLTLRGDRRLGTSRVFLGGGVGLRRFASNGSVYESFATRLHAREAVGFVRLSVQTIEGIDVFAQGGGGVSVVDTRWTSRETATQRSVVPLAEGLAGVALYLPRRLQAQGRKVRLTGGLELGAGYTWRGDLDLRPRVVTDDDPIAADGAAFGDVALRGLTWRLGLFIRFQ